MRFLDDSFPFLDSPVRADSGRKRAVSRRLGHRRCPLARGLEGLPLVLSARSFFDSLIAPGTASNVERTSSASANRDPLPAGELAAEDCCLAGRTLSADFASPARPFGKAALRLRRLTFELFGIKLSPNAKRLASSRASLFCVPLLCSVGGQKTKPPAK